MTISSTQDCQQHTHLHTPPASTRLSALLWTFTARTHQPMIHRWQHVEHGLKVKGPVVVQPSGQHDSGSTCQNSEQRAGSFFSMRQGHTMCLCAYGCICVVPCKAVRLTDSRISTEHRQTRTNSLELVRYHAGLRAIHPQPGTVKHVAAA